MTADQDIDLTWREYAESSRKAMGMLGWPCTSPCLPHEAEPCGAGYGMHAAAHLARIKAIAEHELEHLGMPEIATEIYEHALAQLAHHDDRPIP